MTRETGISPGLEPSDGPSDAELLALHVAGDPDAFGTLFSRHRDRLWAVAVRTLSDPEEAADALQDAMLSAFRRAGTFRGDAAVTTWLHRIVVNACLDRMRRRAVRPTVSGSDERMLDAMASAGPQVDHSAETDLSLDVLAALRTLPHDQRIALVYVDMLGYPVADAAKAIGVSEGTIKSRCARGRARLLPRLAHLGQRGAATASAAGSVVTSAADSPARLRPPPGGREDRGNRRRLIRNRSASGPVLPAGEGGDEAQ